jgi:hypothetical protein
MFEMSKPIEEEDIMETTMNPNTSPEVFATYIAKALRYVEKAKYRDVVVKNDNSTFQIIFDFQSYIVTDAEAFKKTAQARFEDLLVCNPGYKDKTYLACVAYEETIKQCPKEMIDGGSPSKT